MLFLVFKIFCYAVDVLCVFAETVQWTELHIESSKYVLETTRHKTQTIHVSRVMNVCR